jgi:hypothetical protein
LGVEVTHVVSGAVSRVIVLLFLHHELLGVKFLFVHILANIRRFIMLSLTVLILIAKLISISILKDVTRDVELCRNLRLALLFASSSLSFILILL